MLQDPLPIQLFCVVKFVLLQVPTLAKHLLRVFWLLWAVPPASVHTPLRAFHETASVPVAS